MPEKPVKKEVIPYIPQKTATDQPPFRDKDIEYLNKNSIVDGSVFLDKLGLDITHVGDKVAVNDGIPRIFVMKDGKISTLEENQMEVGSRSFWEAANMGQIFAYPAGGRHPVQIQMERESGAPTVKLSDPLDPGKDIPVKTPKEPKMPREPRWYHRLFKFGNNRIVCDKYDQYVRDHKAWKDNAVAEAAKAKTLAEDINHACGAHRTAGFTAGEKGKAAEARQKFSEARALMRAKEKVASVEPDVRITDKVIGDALSFYKPKPELHDEWIKKNPNDPKDTHKGTIYTKEQFDLLKPITLTDDLKVGGQKVSDREFGVLAMFSSMEPDIGMAAQEVQTPTEGLMNAFVSENFTEDEAKAIITANSSELTTRSLMLGVPRSDSGNYIAPAIQPARERALQALQEYRDGDSTKLAGILARMVGDVGRTSMANITFSDNMLGQNQMAAEMLDMMHRDPKLEAAVRQQYEQSEARFHANHPEFVKPLSFDEQVGVIRNVQKLEEIRKKSMEAKKQLLDARIKGEELSPEDKARCTRDILKTNLFTNQYVQANSNATSVSNRNKQTKEYHDLVDHSKQMMVKYPSSAFSAKGGSSTPASPGAMLITGLTQRTIPKPELMDVLGNPAAMSKFDAAIDDLIKREGLDKATTRQLSDQLTMADAFTGTSLEQKMLRAAQEKKGPEQEKNEPEKKGPDQEKNEPERKDLDAGLVG